MGVDLKPCPFCGSENVEVKDYSYVLCNACKAYGPTSFERREETVRLWNERAVEPPSVSIEALVREVHKLREMLDLAKRAAGGAGRPPPLDPAVVLKELEAARETVKYPSDWKVLAQSMEKGGRAKWLTKIMKRIRWW